MSRRGTATATAAGITTSYGTPFNLKHVPDECFLADLHALLDTISGTTPKVTWKITFDSAGLKPYTDEKTETIILGQGDATKGGVRTIFEIDYAFAKNRGTSGSLFLWAKVDNGTANLTPYLTFRDQD